MMHEVVVGVHDARSCGGCAWCTKLWWVCMVHEVVVGVHGGRSCGGRA